MVKEKDYFVLVSERPSLNGRPDDIVEQTLKPGSPPARPDRRKRDADITKNTYRG